jgi:RNA polymerase-binding transcription factor
MAANAMDDLNSQQYKQLADLLGEQQSDLLTKARDGLELSMNRERDGGRDSLDESTEEELISTELRLRDREKKLLTKIRAAQQRLEDKVINECEDCGEAIGFKRLIVRPVTTLCISCKELSEEQEAASEAPFTRGRL